MRTTGLQIVALIALVWGVYANSLHNPFEFDDWHVVSQNPSVHQIENIPSFFSDPSLFSLLVGNRDYRPVFLTSMAISWKLGGGSTVPFHVTSVLLHMGNVLLLFLLVRRFLRIAPLGAAGREAGRDVGLEAGREAAREAAPALRSWAAFLAAALFAVHPLATDSVDYASAQSVPLAAFFYLLAFHLFVRVENRIAQPDGDVGSRGNIGPRGVVGSTWAGRIGSLLAYTLALLSKPIAVTFPLILILWELLFGRRDARFSRILKHIPYTLITLAYLLLRRTLFSEPFGATEPVRPLLVHYFTQTKALVFYYLQLAIAPFRLNIDPEFPLSTRLLDPPVVLSIVVLIVIAALLIRLRRDRALVFWALWFPICLLITTYAVVLGQVVNEHRVYLSLVGYCAVIGILLYRIWTALPIHLSDLTLGSRAGRTIVTGAMILVLCLFGYRTVARNITWSSGVQLWGDASRNGGTWRTHMNYGLALEAEGSADEALAAFQEAVRRGPYAWAHMNLGLAYVKRDKFELGLGHLRTAVRLWPDLPEGRNFLGYGLHRAGDPEAAVQEIQKAIELRPNYLKAYEQLARVHESQGRYYEAVEVYKTMRGLDPGIEWVGNRIEMLQQRHGPLAPAVDDDLLFGMIVRGEYGEAVEILSARYAQDPENPQTLFNLAFCRQRLGQRDEAIRFYRELLVVDPVHRQATFNLAYAYRDGPSREDWLRSRDLFERAIEIDSTYVEVFHHLATLYGKLGEVDRAREYDRLYVARGGTDDLLTRSRERLASEPEAEPDRSPER